MKRKGLFVAIALGVVLILALPPAVGPESVSAVAASSPGQVGVVDAPAAELHVCPAGCAYSSMQAAVDAASDGDTIKVATGTYTDMHVRPRDDITTTGVVNQVVYLTKTLTIGGGYTTTNWTTPDPDGNPTTLDAQGQGRVIYITGDISPTLEGLRITGGTTTEFGGGILAYGADLTVSQTVISGNTAVDKGGGIAIRQATAAAVIDSQIHSNVTFEQEGGGVAAYDGSHMDLIRSWVVGNSSPENDGGGVFAGGGGTVYIENSIIAGNYANDSAGGISLGTPGPHRVINSDIVGNLADDEGSAIATYEPVQVVVTNTLIISNTGNTAIDDEYGNNTTFLLNFCDTYGNSPDGTVGLTITRTNCLGSPPEDGLDPQMAGGALPGGVGPAFAAQWLSYDYRLEAGSPAIGAGTTAGAPETDIEGTPRIAAPDMGAYEFPFGLTVTKQAGPDPVQAGAQLTYTIRVTNIGIGDLHATVTDTLPAYVTPGGVRTWTPVISAPAGVWTQQVVVTVEVGYAGVLTNVVEVTTAEGAAGTCTAISASKVWWYVYLPVGLRSYPP